MFWRLLEFLFDLFLSNYTRYFSYAWAISLNAEIPILDPQAWDSRIMRVSRQVYVKFDQ